MREIKFRAWNDSPAVKAMLNWGHLRQVPFQELNGKHLHLMQFTGLKDKNGKEIWEGDILRYTRKNWKCHGHPEDKTDLVQICEIYWDNEDFAFRERGRWKTGGGWSGCLGFSDDRADKNTIEVIGNIYENPELLSPSPEKEIISK